MDAVVMRRFGGPEVLRVEQAPEPVPGAEQSVVDAVAVSAAAGGVGHVAVQLATALGAGRVIGIASTPGKRSLVTSSGADIALGPADGGIGDRLRESANGAGADLVVDLVGGTLARSAPSGPAPFGRLVTIGWHGGAEHGPVRVSTGELADRSIGCAGFWMRHAVADGPLLCAITDELFTLAAKGEPTAHIDRIVSLAGADDAHAAMAAGATAGEVLIDVSREL